MDSKIFLVRHGKPIMHKKGVLDTSGYNQWIIEYNAAPVSTEYTQHDLKEPAFSDSIVFCSNLRRSIDSAESMFLNRTDITLNSIFREADIPFLHIPKLKLPLSGWALFARLCWALNLGIGNQETLFKAVQRAKIATQLLISATEEGKPVVMFGHGIMNFLIAREIRRSGWTGKAIPSNKYWAVNQYCKKN